ncbi:MAG TPA: hypothetical protein PKI10_12775, partial [Syntrophorhabdus sp.]|nr:hypothetical protein [Syntrophorhabdus sp.]
SCCYIFIDSHLCINHPKYIEYGDDGTAGLTDYARYHMEECCLVFDLSIQKSSNSYGKQYFIECVLYRDSTSDIVFEAHYNLSPENDTVDNRAKMLSTYIRELSDVLQSLPGRCARSLKPILPAIR